jgi:hypothetical protein
VRSKSSNSLPGLGKASAWRARRFLIFVICVS